MWNSNDIVGGLCECISAGPLRSSFLSLWRLCAFIWSQTHLSSCAIRGFQIHHQGTTIKAKRPQKGFRKWIDEGTGKWSAMIWKRLLFYYHSTQSQILVFRHQSLSAFQIPFIITVVSLIHSLLARWTSQSADEEIARP